MARRTILALRVLGKSLTNRTCIGGERLAESTRRPRRGSPPPASSLGAKPGRQDDEAPDALALDLVGDADGGRLGDGGMSDGRALDLGRAEPLAGNLERVVAPAVEEPEAVGVDRGPVAVGPDVGPARPVCRQVALRIVPEAPGHPRPGLRADQLANPAAERPALGVEDVDGHPQARAAEGARLQRRRSAAS